MSNVSQGPASGQPADWPEPLSPENDPNPAHVSHVTGIVLAYFQRVGQDRERLQAELKAVTAQRDELLAACKRALGLFDQVAMPDPWQDALEEQMNAAIARAEKAPPRT